MKSKREEVLVHSVRRCLNRGQGDRSSITHRRCVQGQMAIKAAAR